MFSFVKASPVFNLHSPKVRSERISFSLGSCQRTQTATNSLADFFGHSVCIPVIPSNSCISAIPSAPQLDPGNCVGKTAEFRQFRGHPNCIPAILSAVGTPIEYFLRTLIRRKSRLHSGNSTSTPLKHAFRSSADSQFFPSAYRQSPSPSWQSTLHPIGASFSGNSLLICNSILQLEFLLGSLPYAQCAVLIAAVPAFASRQCSSLAAAPSSSFSPGHPFCATLNLSYGNESNAFRVAPNGFSLN